MADDQGGKREATWSEAMGYPLAAVGAMAGAAVGGVLTYVAARSGFYAIIAVGVWAGFGAALFARWKDIFAGIIAGSFRYQPSAMPPLRRKDIVVGIIAGCITLVAGLFVEWQIFPFVADDSLGYFVRHVQDLPAFRMLAHLIGVAAAFFLSWRK